jgi:APA family basic amino acid/polyamine antiporter
MSVHAAAPVPKSDLASKESSLNTDDLHTDGESSASATASQAGASALRRDLSAWSLIALGIANTIGAGIFVITGLAAARYAGPAVTISYLIGALACLCAGLCYAELAAMSPDAGSAYSYAYASMGETVAWIIGWDLIVEFLMSGSTVAVGWSGFLSGMLENWHIHIPSILAGAPIGLTAEHRLHLTGSWFNLPAAGLIAVQCALLYQGIRESRFFFNAVVILLIGLIALIVIAGAIYVHPSNWHPFIPPNIGQSGRFGWSGVMAAAALVFYSYIGFEAISTATRETRNPGRDLPIGLLGSLAVCTGLYLLTSLVMTGLVPYQELGGDQPVLTALRGPGHSLEWLVPIISIGIVVGLSAASMGSMYAQIRIFHAMATDGLLPPIFAEVHPRHRVPHLSTLIVGVVCAVTAGLLPLEVLGELVSIGTLLAFAIVCACVMILRVRDPLRSRPFRVGGLWVVAPIGIAVCLYMMVSLPIDTWLRLIVWMALGLVLYACWRRHRSAWRQRARGG